MWRGKQDYGGRFCLVFAELKQPGALFFTWENNKQKLCPKNWNLIRDPHKNLGACRDRPLV